MKFFVTAIIAFASCVGLSQVALGRSVQEQLVQVWAVRADRYVAQQMALDKLVASTLAALKAANDAGSPDVGVRTGQFLGTLKDASFVRGRFAVLAAFRAHTQNKPSDAATEIWFQERFGELMSRAVELSKAGERLKSEDWNDDTGAKIAEFSNFALFMGNVAELSQLDRNLATHIKANSAHEDQRLARSAFYRRFAPDVAQYIIDVARFWTSACQNPSMSRTKSCNDND